MAYEKMIITMKGQSADIAKVRASLDEGGEFRDIADGTAVAETKDEEVNIQKYDLKYGPNEMFFAPNGACTDYIDLYQAGEDKVGYFAALNSLFEPVFSAFPSVSFFIACDVENDDIYDYGAGYACSYTIFENGTEQEKESWTWDTPTNQADSWSRFQEEREHYSYVMDARSAWIVEKRKLWLLEGSGDTDAIQAAQNALAEAEKKAVEADVPYTPDWQEESDDDTPVQIAIKRIEACCYSRAIEDNADLDLSGLGLTDDDFNDNGYNVDGIGKLSPVPDSVKASYNRSGVLSLNLSGNPLTCVPSTLKNDKSLKKWLIGLDLSNTRISALPDWFDCPQLKKLNLTGTGVTALPPALAEKVKAGTLEVIGLGEGAD